MKILLTVAVCLFSFLLTLAPRVSSFSYLPSWRRYSASDRFMFPRGDKNGVYAAKSYDYLLSVPEDNTALGYNRKSKVKLCCPGFDILPAKKGCPKELYTSSQSLLQLAKSKDLRDLVTSITEAGLGTALLGKGPFTLFAPNNKAFEEFKKSNGFRANGDQTKEALKNVLLNHIVPGKYVAEQLYGGKELKTLAGNIIRISKTYDGKNTIIEGSQMLHDYNLGASNGILHVIDRVIISPKESLKDFLETRTEYQRFKSYLDEADIKINSPVTVFLFSDKSIEDNDASFLQQSCKRSKIMIQNHIIKGRHYMLDFAPQRTARTLSGEKLVIRHENNGFKVNDADVILPNIPITDGVLHVINKAVIPLKARDIVGAASRFDYSSQFIKILKSVDADQDTLKNGNWTVFIPTNEAFANLPSEVGERIQDMRFLSKVVYYHVVQGAILPREFKNDQLLPAHSSSLKPRINLYRNGMVITVNGVQLNKYTDVCNGVIYIIDEVLIPPETTILEYLGTNENLTTFFTLLKNSGLAALMTGSSPFTIFAPTNQALEANLKLTQEAIENPPETVIKVLKYHIVPSVVYSNALTTSKCFSYYKSFYRTRTIQSHEGNLLKLTGTGTGTVVKTFMVNDVSVMHRDIRASDGVIHVIDDVLQLPRGGFRIMNEIFSSL